MNRRQYTNEFKAEAVKLVRSTGQSASQTAKDLGIPANVLYKWMTLFGSPNDGSGKITPNEHEELMRLRRENRILKEERDILKKAAAYFAKEQY
jgi:transposase